MGVVRKFHQFFIQLSMRGVFPNHADAEPINFESLFCEWAHQGPNPSEWAMQHAGQKMIIKLLRR
tara:strand:- start:2080 stop:2274 length:195 start_codon:yes stop_codon:yes gene_type:complete